MNGPRPPLAEHDVAELGKAYRLEAGAAPIGRFHTWWRGNSLPRLPEFAGLSIGPMDEPLPDGIIDLEAGEMRQRMERGHRLWLARIESEPAGWGWSATRSFTVGELGIVRALPSGNRYLWDFVTLPSWRGRGIYPRLLQAIVTGETEADRFWLGHDLPNEASRRGIAKAGFREVGVLFREPDGSFALVPTGPLHLVDATAALFDVPIAPARQARHT